MSIHTLPLTIQVQGISLLLPKELELLLLLVLLELGMMAGGVQRWVVVKHRLALLNLKIFRRIFVLVVQMLLIVTICTPASAENGLLSFPWLIWFNGTETKKMMRVRYDPEARILNAHRAST